MMLKTIPRVAIPIGKEEVAIALSTFMPGEVLSKEDVTRFEKEFGTYLGVKPIFACNSGRTALHVALQALNLKPGAEVIVPAYTCAIVFEVILRLGLKPVFVDVNPETFNIEPALIGTNITSETRAIIPVHLFGRPCDMNPIMEIAEKHNLYVVEDVAQALGAEYEKSKVGTFGDLAIFSFAIGKSMTSGEGGIVAVKNEELVEKVSKAQSSLGEANRKWMFHVSENILAMKLFSNSALFPFIRHYLGESLDAREQRVLANCLSLERHEVKLPHSSTLTLAKMPPMSAKIARVQLRKLDKFNEKRIMNALRLTKLLGELDDIIDLPETNRRMKSTFTKYPVKLLKGSRDELVKNLGRQGVDNDRPYHYLKDLYENLNLNTPNALMLTKCAFTVPNHILITDSDIDMIADVLKLELKANLYSQ